MNQNLEKPITMKDLGGFTDEVILPGVERIIRGMFGESGKKLKRIIDEFNYKLDEIMQILERMQDSLERIEKNAEEIHTLRIKMFKRLYNGVDVLEKRLGVTPEPMPPIN